MESKAKIICFGLFVILLLSPSLLFAFYNDEVYDAPGVDPRRETLSSIPQEHIDPFTGGLTLSFEDIRLPGNGGLDLVIQRTFNSKNVCSGWTCVGSTCSCTQGENTWLGYGWTLHFGRLHRSTGVTGHVIEMPDGSMHAAYTKAYPTFITKDYWLYDDNAKTLTLTNGTKIYYQPASGSSKLSGHILYRATKIEDANGNAINIYYQASGNDIISYVIDSVGRRLDFTTQTINGAVRLTSISGAGVSITYTHQALAAMYETVLTRANLPVGNPWTYTYGSGAANLYGNSTSKYELGGLTTPYGGTIAYEYGFPLVSIGGSTLQYRAVTKKTTGGRDIAAGTWNILYSQGNYDEYTNVTDPCGRTIKYSYFGYGSTYLPDGSMWKIGLPKSKEIVGEETVNYDWLSSPYISTDDYIMPTGHRDYYIYVPLLGYKWITRGGVTYKTNYSNYDSYGNPQAISETGDKSRNRSISYWYNTSRNIVQNKPASETVSGGFPGNFTINYSYDTDGNLTRLERYGVVTTYSYYANGNLYSATDANNKTTYYQWTNGRVSRITNPLYFISRSINTDGTIASETNGRGYTTYFDYDNNLRPISIDPPVGNTTYFTYPPDNSYKKESRGGYYIYRYSDGFGRPSGTSDSKGVTTDIVYKSCGPQDYTDSNVGDKTYYDNFGRVSRVLHKDNNDITYSYSGSNLTVTDEDKKTTALTYNAFGNPDEKLLVSVRDALSNTTNYDYNILGALTGVVQGALSRSFVYNSKNFLISETHPETGTVTYGRDNIGNMTSKTDALGTKNYTYDDLNQLTQIGYTGGNVTFTYDKANNRTSMDSPAAAIDYTYDAANRLTRKTEIIAGRTYTTDYEYDGNDNVVNIYYPSGRRVYHTYNSNNQVTGMDYFGGSVNGVTYNTAGLPTYYDFNPGPSTSISYNSRNLTTRINAGPANDVGYGYDNRGNMISMTDYNDGAKNQSFLYDSVNRLTGFDGAWGTGSYVYTPTGNRSSKTIAGSTTTYSYSSNRLSSASGGEPAAFTYNGYGSPTGMTWQGSNCTLGYDALNNLTGFKLGTTTLGSYTYDGDGMRVTKTAAGKTVVYHYDREGRIISEDDGAGNFIADYVYLNGKLVAKVANDAFISPDAPANLSATAISSSQINLSWTDNSTNESGFRIERKTGVGGTYTEIATVGANITTYSSIGLTPDTTYYYRVRAYNAGGESAYSNEANATTATTPPPAPTSLSAIAVSSSQINLFWTDNSTNETGFKIERKTAGGVYSQIGSVNANTATYSDTGLSPETTYYYRVRAYNAVGDSNYSNEANATTLFAPPAAPTGLTATAVSSGQIDLSWTDNSANESGFRIERKTGVGGTYTEIATVGANITTYSNIGLTPDTTYYYRVRAYNAGGESAYSNEANATTLAPPPQPNITVSPASHNFGNIVTGSSSAARTFTVQNIGALSLSIGTLSITGANPAEFSKTSDNCTGQTLAPSVTCAVQVVFTPSSLGARSASLNIPSNDPDTPTLTVPLNGTGVGPQAGGTVDLPKTGQTASYAAGDDGAVQTGIAWPNPRFTDNGDGTVTDNLTGLVWLKDANCVKTNYPAIAQMAFYGLLSWTEALTFVAYVNAGIYPLCGAGRNDWRLPNVNESESLSNAGVPDPVSWLNTQGFVNVQSFYYWTSTTRADNTNWAWLWQGGINAIGIDKDQPLHVWLVRGTTSGSAKLWRTGQTTSYYVLPDDGGTQAGVAWPLPRFQVNVDATVTDKLTGLVWAPDAGTPTTGTCTGGAKTWQEALNYVACLNNNTYLGYTDWRLPNKKELHSLVDFSKTNPALPSGHPFTLVQTTGYWSSTTDAGNANNAWSLYMTAGTLGRRIKTDPLYAWPVRGGMNPNISASPASHNFGNVSVGGSSAAKTFTFTNTGTANLVIGTITLSGPNASEFNKSGDNCSGQILVPSSNCTVQVIFSPTTSGAKSASLSIQSNDPDTPTLGIPLSGTGTTVSYSISGKITFGRGYLSGVTMSLTGAATGTAITDVSGNYSFAGLGDGAYTVTPSKAGYVFTPASKAVSISGANVTGQNFTATATGGATYSISGTVTTTGGSPLSGVTMSLSGGGTGATTTDENGNYTFAGLANGTYTITPGKAGYTFSPASRSVTVNGGNVTAQDFSAALSGGVFSISGKVTTTSGVPFSGVTITLSGAGLGTTSTDASGNYAFSALGNGSYTITPSKTGYRFTPTSRSVTVSGANVANQDFTVSR